VAMGWVLVADLGDTNSSHSWLAGQGTFSLKSNPAGLSSGDLIDTGRYVATSTMDINGKMYTVRQYPHVMVASAGGIVTVTQPIDIWVSTELGTIVKTFAYSATLVSKNQLLVKDQKIPGLYSQMTQATLK